ncbi:hypothetical protein OTU49_009447, partial [Cherax quadricarinatus]
MSDPKRDRDSDRDSLTDWTLVDREGTPEDISNDGAQQEEDEDGAESTITPEGATAQGEDEEEEDDVEESEGGSEEEALSDDLVSLGQKVQEIKGESIKASSGSDSSDIETLECPDPGEFYEDHALACNSMNSSLFSSSSLHSFTFVGGSEEGDVESLAGTDISVLDAEKEKLADEETDLSLASSPSLPDDLPAIKPDTQYKHTPDKDLNSRLNIVVALTLACVLGLGLGHFLGWSSRSVWHESMSSAQVLDEINLENENLESEIIRLQRENIAPIKIRGKDGKYARNLREKINRLIIDNEELRAAVGKLQYADLPDGDATAFTSALEKNYNLRLAVGKLTHLGPDLSALRVSSNDLQTENEELKIKVGKLRYQQQPLPQELNAVARDVEKLRKTIEEASQKKKVPPNLNNAKTYVSYMSQILSAIHTLHEFGEGSLVEKVDVATDIFEDLAPGSIKLNSQLRQKLNVARARFSQIQASLSRKWEKLKELSQPDKMAAVGRDTLARMNRVIVNVVNKVKEIGRSNILRRGKTSIEKTLSTFTDQLTALGLQFDKTWKDLEGEVVVKSDEAADLTADDDNKDDKNKNKDAKNKNKDAKNKNKDAQNKNKDAKNKNKDAKNKNKDTKNKNKDAKNKIKYTGTEDVVEIVPKKREVPESEVKKELLVDKEDEEVGNGKVKKEPHKEAVPKEEEVVSVKARQKPVVKVGAKKDFQAEDVASEQSSEAETKSHKGREGKRRGGGEDKKKIPDDKRKNVAKKIKEKVEEKKQESKRHRSRRNRISQKEEKKDKKEGESQKEESNKKQNDKKNKKSEEKHDSHGNHNDKSRNYHQRNERDRNIKEKDENQRYYKGHYNKYDKKH